MTETTTKAPTEIRPKVFVAPDGSEWRAVGDVLQARIVDETLHHYDENTGTGTLEAAFGQSAFESTEAWLLFLLESFRELVPAAEAALAHPMTAEEAEADDEEVAALSPEEPRAD